MPPTFRTLTVERHARIGLVGDPATATEIWLILHGYGMLAQGVLHWFQAAERSTRLLVAPEGLSRFYQDTKGIRTVGASWMTREAREEELLDQQSYLDRVVRELVAPEAPLQIHGFSQGVATALRWVARGTRPVSRLVCWGGAAPHEVEPRAVALAVTEPTIHFVVGNGDARVPPQAVEGDAARFRNAGVDATVHRFEGGHRVDDGVLAMLDTIPLHERREERGERR